jgi:hypothetical protein
VATTTAGFDVLAGRGRDSERPPVAGQRFDLHVFHLRNKAATELEPVGDERLDGHRRADVGVGEALLGAVRAERECAVGVVQVRREAFRLEAHATRHVVRPEAHRRAEDAQALARFAEMRCQRQAVGTSADDGGIEHGKVTGCDRGREYRFGVGAN